MQCAHEAKILSYLHKEIDFYDTAATKNHSKWYILVVITIAGAAVGGLCATVQAEGSLARLSLGIPSILATIAAAINSTMNYRGECSRQASTAEALRRELLRFETKRPPYDVACDESLTKLIQTATAILDKELASWVDAQRKAGPSPTP